MLEIKFCHLEGSYNENDFSSQESLLVFSTVYLLLSMILELFAFFCFFLTWLKHDFSYREAPGGKGNMCCQIVDNYFLLMFSRGFLSLLNNLGALSHLADT